MDGVYIFFYLKAFTRALRFLHDSYTNSCSTILSHNGEWARLREGVCRAWNVAAGGMGHDDFEKRNSACAIRRAPEHYS